MFFRAGKSKWSFKRLGIYFRRTALRWLSGPNPKLLQSGQLDPQYIREAEAVATKTKDEPMLLLLGEIQRLEALNKSLYVTRANDQKRVATLSEEVKVLRLCR